MRIGGDFFRTDLPSKLGLEHVSSEGEIIGDIADGRHLFLHVSSRNGENPSCIDESVPFKPPFKNGFVSLPRFTCHEFMSRGQTLGNLRYSAVN